MQKPPPPPNPNGPPIHPDTIGVMGLFLKKRAEDDFNRDLAQAMKALKPKPPLKG